VFDRLGLYRSTYALSMKDELYYTVAALIFGTIPQMVLFTLYPGISTSRVALVYALVFSIVLVGSSRAILHRVRGSRRFGGRRRTSVVGSAERVAQAAESLDLPDDCETVLIVVDDIDETVREVGLSGGTAVEDVEWFAAARNWGCDVLILTEILAPAVTASLLEAAEREHIRLAFAPPRITRCAYELSLQTDGRQALIVPSRLRACTPRAQLIKRIMDVVFACLALVLFAPVMCLAALAVYLDSGRPILFAQERVGLRGEVFRILKFRSMQLDAEHEVGAVWATATDPRKTRVGAFLRRFSIDELPQLVNVLRGDMSLVGPRPERPIFVELFRETLSRYDDRHLLRPGITGWSQVHMKRVLEPSQAGEKLGYDLQYVENWSPFLDVSVLFQTLCEFLFHRAA
jgi:exopolysaccharide biosynthesis polyprenyl glycosylphosphotransferase